MDDINRQIEGSEENSAVVETLMSEKKKHNVLRPMSKLK